MAGLGDRLRAAFAAHQAGRFDEAERGYQAVLAAQPGAAEALYLYGMLALQQGRAGDAVSRLEQARAASPQDPRIHLGLGQALDRAGRIAEALPAFSQAAEAEPSNPVAWRGMAAAALASGDDLAAERAFGRVLAAQPEDRAGWFNLAVLRQRAGRAGEALDAVDRALALAPDDADAMANRAAILLDLDRAGDAVGAAERALSLAPGHGNACVNLAAALERVGRHAEAAEAARAGLADHPGNASLHLNLGLALMAVGDGTGAEAALKQAAAIDGASPGPPEALGALLQRQGRPGASEAASEHAIELGGETARRCTNLSVALLAQAEQAAALSAARRAVTADPDDEAARAHLVTVLNYADLGMDAGEAAREWATRHETPLREAWPAFSASRDAEARLRVGYLSPDLRAHSVAYFLEPVLGAHDPAAVEVFCYADVVSEDAVSARLRELASTWCNVAQMTPSDIAARIREDQIDVLIDLAGHTWPRGLLVMARKPAPLQASWIGYPGPTGLAAIDMRITDAIADPPGTEDRYSERLARLDPVFLCYGPPSEAPAPVRHDGPPTFASFNNPAKIAPPVFEVWAALLRAVPDARLLLKYAGLDEPATAERLRGRFAAAGLDPERLDMRGRAAAVSEHLAAYSDVDVALDTFPYNGTTTTCEALWMGVPVITLAGAGHPGRVGASLLSALGKADWVAADPAAYIETAAAMMADRGALAAGRDALRARMLASPLCDARQVAAGVEALFRAAWEVRGAGC